MLVVKELARLLLSEDQELPVKALVNGLQGFHPVERIAVYKENGKEYLIIIARELPALLETGG